MHGRVEELQKRAACSQWIDSSLKFVEAKDKSHWWTGMSMLTSTFFLQEFPE